MKNNVTYTNTILSELDRAGSIINNYLTFSKLQIEKIELKNTAQVVAHSIKIISPYSRLRNVDIHQSLQESLYVHIDSSKFVQAMLNIMNGKIEVKSVQGQGTQFSVFLPLSNDRPGTTQDPAPHFNLFPEQYGV